MIWHEKELNDQRHRNPANWKWGIFYYNPKDSRLFVPKPDPKKGATVNFANPRSILAFLSPIFLIIVLFVVYALVP